MLAPASRTIPSSSDQLSLRESWKYRSAKSTECVSTSPKMPSRRPSRPLGRRMRSCAIARGSAWLGVTLNIQLSVYRSLRTTCSGRLFPGRPDSFQHLLQLLSSRLIPGPRQNVDGSEIAQKDEPGTGLATLE